MSKKTAIINLLIVIISITNSFVLCGSTTKFINYFQTNEGVTVITNDGYLNISKPWGEVFKISFSKDSLFQKPSDALYFRPQNFSNIVRNSSDRLDIRLGHKNVTINKKPFKIKIKTGEDLRREVVIQGPFNKNSKSGVSFDLTSRERIMGGGAPTSHLDRRGQKIQIGRNYPSIDRDTQDHLFPLPLFISSNSYMIFYDTTQRAVADIGSSNSEVFRLEAEESFFNIYIFTGENFKNLIKNYTDITGTQPLPPLWALGTVFKGDSFISQEESKRTVNNLHKNHYYPDAVLLSHKRSYSDQNKDHIPGNFNWDNESWPLPGRLIREFKNEGINTILYTSPYISNLSKNFSEAESKKLLAKNDDNTPFLTTIEEQQAGIVDLLNMPATDWLWTKHVPLIDQGVAGWCALSKNLHNLYSHKWQKIFNIKYRALHHDKRLFFMNSQGYAGSQRYSIFPYLRHTPDGWNGLQDNISSMLAMAMCGLPYMHSTVNAPDKELFIRELQYATFSPLLKIDAKALLDIENEEKKEIIKKYLNLRKKLILYNYTAAYKQTEKGEPLARPLCYEHPHSYLIDIADTYFWGDDMIVSPVNSPEQTSKRVELPVGKWFHFFNNDIYDGGRGVNIETSIEEIPVFVKAGSFIPIVEPFNTVDELKTDNIDIYYYHHQEIEKSQGRFFIDEGSKVYSIMAGDYQLFDITLNFDGRDLNFNISHNNGIYLGRPGRREIDLVIKNFQRSPRNVRVNGSSIDYRFRFRDRELRIPFTMGEEDVHIRVRKDN
ncbi:glycoside hydrolase family 31 protein [Marinilabiliaceae bacterium ANBcel2]|nr:glycoside hydrolase family 31 protein [Marinilabiliaceae bacterium ANBcel2]